MLQNIRRAFSDLISQNVVNQVVLDVFLSSSSSRVHKTLKIGFEGFVYYGVSAELLL